MYYMLTAETLFHHTPLMEGFHIPTIKKQKLFDKEFLIHGKRGIQWIGQWSACSDKYAPLMEGMFSYILNHDDRFYIQVPIKVSLSNVQ